MSCRENPYPRGVVARTADDPDRRPVADDVKLLATDDALANLTHAQRAALGVGPGVGDTVVVSEAGLGWHLQLTGEITELTTQQVTIGEGYTIDLDDGLDVQIERYEAKTEAVSQARQAERANHVQQLSAISNQNVALRERIEELVDQLRRAEKVAQRLRAALAAAGVPEGIIDLLERG